METQQIMTIDPKAKILVDADVLIHFIKGEQTGILHKIFPNKLFIIDIVFEEVFKATVNRINVENLIKNGMLHELALEHAGNEVKKEYFRLKSSLGKGESAIMAYCRFHKDVLASSNLSDIKTYCQQHNITYLTTMDFIAEAFRTGVLSETACDNFIQTVKSKGSKLIKKVDRIRDYKTR